MVWKVAVTPDGRRALSAPGDDTLQLWNLTTGGCLRTFTGHKGELRMLAVTPDGRTIIWGGRESAVNVLTLPEGLLA